MRLQIRFVSFYYYIYLFQYLYFFIIMLITKDDWKFWVYSMRLSRWEMLCLAFIISYYSVSISYRSSFKTTLMIIVLFHVFLYFESNWYYILNNDCHFFKKGNFQLYFSLLLKWNLILSLMFISSSSVTYTICACAWCYL